MKFHYFTFVFCQIKSILFQVGYMWWVGGGQYSLCDYFVAIQVLSILFPSLNEVAISKFSLGTTTPTLNCFWSKLHLFTNASLAQIFPLCHNIAPIIDHFLLLQGQALTRSSHLELKHKRFLNNWFGPKWICL